jgi:hypothetical protein
MSLMYKSASSEHNNTLCNCWRYSLQCHCGENQTAQTPEPHSWHTDLARDQDPALCQNGLTSHIWNEGFFPPSLFDIPLSIPGLICSFYVSSPHTKKVRTNSHWHGDPRESLRVLGWHKKWRSIPSASDNTALREAQCKNPTRPVAARLTSLHMATTTTTSTAARVCSGPPSNWHKSHTPFLD